MNNRLITFIIMLLAFVMSAHPVAAFSKRLVPAKAAVVMDDDGAVLFSQFPNAKLAPASTVKLVTAMVVLDRLAPETVVRISRNAARVRSIPPRIRQDEEMTVSDLLHLALMKSVNAAAVALAEAAAGSERDFVPLMNKKAAEIGLSNTLFANASGLPHGGTQYSTAADLALIMKRALTYPLIREILGKKTWFIRTAGGRDLFIENSDQLLWRDANVIGGKTGFTGNARHCFVCAIDSDKGPLFAAVLGARTRSSLWRSTTILADLARNPAACSGKQRTSADARPSARPVQRPEQPPMQVPDAGLRDLQFSFEYNDWLSKMLRQALASSRMSHPLAIY